VLLLLTTWLYHSHKSDEDFSDVDEHQSVEDWADPTIPRVISWASFFGAKLMQDSLLKHFNRHACPYKCLYTDRKDRYSPSSPSVVIYHSWDMSSRHLPPPSHTYRLNVFFSHESTHLSGYNYQYLPRDFFNANMSYRRDADFFLPYDRFEAIEQDVCFGVACS